MKKCSINFIATIVLALILSQFMPWWAVMVAAFATSLFFSLKRSSVFIVPFLAIALLWITQAFWLSNANDFILAKKIAVLLSLNENTYLLILITGLVGGIAAGVSAMFGKQCLTLLTKR